MPPQRMPATVGTNLGPWIPPHEGDPGSGVKGPSWSYTSGIGYSMCGVSLGTGPRAKLSLNLLCHY